MKNSEYVYESNNDEIVISQEREIELIEEINKAIEKNGYKDSLPLHKVVAIAENDMECDFIFKWLNDKKIVIRGTNGTLENEIENYYRIQKVGNPGDKTKGYKALRMSEEKQKELFQELDKLKTKMQNDILTEEESKRYDELVIELTEGSLRLVDWVVNTFKSIQRKERGAFDDEDKKQWGYIALSRAVEMYNVNSGYAFSSYAVICIINKINREWDKINEVPSYMMSNIQKLETIEAKFEERGVELSDEMIIDIMGISYGTLERIKRARNLMEMGSLDNDEEKIEPELDIEGNEEVVEIDDTRYCDGVYVERYDEIKGYREESVTYLSMLKQEIAKQLATLTPREANVLRLRFGMANGIPQTLEEVAKKYNITKERIRQIEAKALRKMRHPRRARQLRNYQNLDIGD